MKFQKYSLILFVFLLVLFSLAPLFWFINHPGEMINGLDTNFPLDPEVWFVRRLYIWNDSLNGGMHFNSSVAGLFFHFLQFAPYKLGLNLLVVQKINLIFWFSMTLLSGFVFSRTFISKRKSVSLIFVLLYACNPFMFNVWENIKVASLSLVVALPLGLSFLELYRTNKINKGALFALQILVSYVCSGIGINPAYFASFFFGLGLYSGYFLIFYEKRGKTLSGIFISIFSFLLSSIYWIYPLFDYLFIASKVRTLENIGFANWVKSLSENTSVTNVFRFFGAWDWYAKDISGNPMYILYAVKYFSNKVFIAFSYLIPTIALFSLLHKGKNSQNKYFFLLLCIFGIFLSSGLHEPTGILYQLLIDKVPFFSFFRSPWYIFTPFIILGVLSLFSSAMDSLFNKTLKSNYFESLLTSILCFAIVVYTYPIWMGKIFRPYVPLDGFYVKIPQYVWEFQKWLANSDANVIFTYPDDQLEKFEWGYKGTDSILGLFTNKNVYAPSFNYSNTVLKEYIEDIYLSLKKNNIDSAIIKMKPLGVDTILIKNDAQTISPIIGADDLSGMSFKTIGKWSIVSLPHSEGGITSPDYIYKAKISENMLPKVLGYLPQGSAIVDENDSELAKVSDKINIYELIEAMRNNEEEGFEYSFETSVNGRYQILLEKASLIDSEVKVLLDGISPRLIKSSSEVLVFEADLSKGKHKLIAYFTERYYVPEQNGEMSIVNKNIKPSLLSIPIANVDPYQNYEVTYETKYEYGSLPYIALRQSSSGGGTYKSETLPANRRVDWNLHTYEYLPVPLVSNFELLLDTDGNQEFGGSSSKIRNFKMTEKLTNKLYVFSSPQNSNSNSVINYDKLSPTKYNFKIGKSATIVPILFKQNYDKGWTIKGTLGTINKTIHLKANGMQNLWFVFTPEINKKYEIVFSQQEWYKRFLILSAFVFVASLVFCIKIFFANSRHE